MKNQKYGRPPKGKTSMSGAERQARHQRRVKIIAEELNEVGLKPVTVFVPEPYIQALRAFEAQFQAQPNIVDVTVHSSNWLCRIIEEFIEQQIGIHPDSEVAKIFHSGDWIHRESIDFEGAAMTAKRRIYEFEKELLERKDEAA
ncbi:hypothetical protein [Methylosarcina fibrata]|uniref:hypothetical protein n=1 Tax=Methylosarcina fibrata TaxID=105972 RepID=UPI0012FA6705|nr:hypothetical protein [Methylosarcina fibrata]